MAPSPIFTGATSAAFEPMKAPAPISVRCFCDAVVIAGDGAGADIGARADMGIADIGEVMGFDARFEMRVLQLDEIADIDAVIELRPAAQPRERPDDGGRADLGVLDVAEGADLGALAAR